MEIKVEKIHKDASIPEFKHDGDAGADVRSVEDVFIKPGEIAVVSLGFRMEIPKGYEVQVRSRSGLASRGVCVFNSPGTIDSGYRGECKVILFNSTNKYAVINKGDRIAQFVPKKTENIRFVESSKISIDTSRGDGGFGSTGMQ